MKGDKKWIQKAISPSGKGALRKKLGAKKGDGIPADKLKKAENSKNPTTRKQATLSFGELIRAYQKSGCSNRHSIEMAYNTMYNEDSPKNKKTREKNKYAIS